MGQHELWQKEIYDSRRERYWNEPIADRNGFLSLLLTFREHQRMFKRLGLKPGDLVLDVGCSSGNFLNHLADRYQCKGVGVDISIEAIEAARAQSAWSSVF